MQLQFLGASRQVTGSRYLLSFANENVLIDCGMFQERAMLSRNWEQPPIKPSDIDYILLTHAHLDHCGLIPRLVAQGFKGPIYTTEPSIELASIIMLDSARIQQEDAKYKKKRHKKENRKGPYPIEPLYTLEDAERAINLLQPIAYNTPTSIGKNMIVTYHEAGHILGSASVRVETLEDGKQRSVLFSGDLGQWDKPLIRDPQLVDGADYVVMESTYGDRNHRDYQDPEDQLADVINKTIERGGNVVIPTFAVERAQELMYHIGRLAHADRIPDVPVFLDSPMAVDVTEVFRRHRDYMDAEYIELFEKGQPPLRFDGLTLTRSVDDSKKINELKSPAIIMASSGMCTGGRIKHHLSHNIQRSECTIVFVGFQATGTLGRIILDGVKEVRIHGRNHFVLAEIAQLHGFSAHGDRDDLLSWIKNFEQPPKQLFLTHGEEQVALKFAEQIRAEMDWNVHVPAYQETANLT